MNELLEYRGHLGSILHSEEDETFHGRLKFIRALVTYEGANTESLERAFRDAVDDYIRLCKLTRARSTRWV
jgi:predicted HicB family RNase H-like nuclease